MFPLQMLSEIAKLGDRKSEIKTGSSMNNLQSLFFHGPYFEIYGTFEKTNLQVVKKEKWVHGPPLMFSSRCPGSFCVWLSQWEMTLKCNAVSHWLSPYAKWSLDFYLSWKCRDRFVNAPSQWEATLHCIVVSHWLGAFPKWSLKWSVSNHRVLSKLFKLWPLNLRRTIQVWSREKTV